MSAPALYRLIYASRATPDTAGRFDAAVHEIVGASQNNNSKVGVTGLLLAANGWFVQALEGSRGEVSATFARICADPRHRVTDIIQAGQADGRAFQSWSMCGRILTPRAAPLLDAMGEAAAFDPRELDATRALRLLMAVSMIADGALDRASA